jgi:hypothetical protein
VVKAHSLLLDACTSYLLLRSDFEAFAVEIKDLKHKLEHPSRYSVLSSLCELCGYQIEHQVKARGCLFDLLP